MTITVLFAIGVYVHRALWTSTVNPLNLQFFFHELWIHILQLLIREFIKIVLSIHGIIIRYTAYWEGFKKKYWQIWFFFLLRLPTTVQHYSLGFLPLYSVCVYPHQSLESRGVVGFIIGRVLVLTSWTSMSKGKGTKRLV